MPSSDGSIVVLDTIKHTSGGWDNDMDNGEVTDIGRQDDSDFDLRRKELHGEDHECSGFEKSTIRRPLFEELLTEIQQPPAVPGRLSQDFYKQIPPSHRLIRTNVDTYQRKTTVWPMASVLCDWRVNSAALFHRRYVNTYDLQRRLPWLAFNAKHGKCFEMYNLYAAGGAFGQRVVIHAHHLPSESGQIAATPFEFGEGMPLISSGMISTHFLRAVECTGLNISLLAVPKSGMCLFDAAASCLYTLRSYAKCSTSYVGNSRKKCLPVPPQSSFGLLRACLVWLLEERNVLKKMNVTVSGGNCHLDDKSTILDSLCEGLVADNRSTTSGASLSLGCTSNQRQRLMMYKKYLVEFVKAGEAELLSFAERFLPKLNSLFTQVLCELYCEKSITVVDFVLGGVRTYTHSSFEPEENSKITSNLFLYKVDLSCEYYYGVVDNDRWYLNNNY
jgi:hypothetical protein